MSDSYNTERKLRQLTGQLATATKQNTELLQYLDARDLQRVQSAVENTIINMASATLAVETYGIDWFRAQALSFQAKQNIANTLLRACAPYRLDNGLWTNIVQGDMTTQAAIEFTLTANAESEI